MRKLREAGLILCGVLFFLTLSVTVTLAFRPLYYLDIDLLKIEEDTGFSGQEIRENYDTLIDYNLYPWEKKLTFPTFPMSEEAEIHFAEVKVIFQRFLFLLPVTGLLFLIGGGICIRRGEYRFLKGTAVCSILVPLILAALIAVNWEWVFVTFHELVFQNDYWLFDPSTDPVILILPDAFFMHCALMILLLLAACSFVCLRVYHRRQMIVKKEAV
ncbi:MAG: TIGR01906 family membrane protein [Eubacteriales bacterium]|nr:TIGR01906 family membrane protein [Eubacteriales bacterium]